MGGHVKGLMLTLVLLHSQSVAVPPAPSSEAEVSTAVVAHLSLASTSKCEVARSTFSWPERWVAGRKPITPWYVSGAESPPPTRVPDDLITAAEAVNKSAVSLDAIRLPEGVVLAGGDESPAHCIARLSRPGMSADGTQALVDVRIEDAPPCRCPSGFIYLLEKRDGQWRVKGEGGLWITDCVCVRKEP